MPTIDLDIATLRHFELQPATLNKFSPLDFSPFIGRVIFFDAPGRSTLGTLRGVSLDYSKPADEARWTFRFDDTTIVLLGSSYILDIRTEDA